LVTSDETAHDADGATQDQDGHRRSNDERDGRREVFFRAQRPALIFELKNETTHCLSPKRKPPHPEQNLDIARFDAAI
jgi:hypothetical protein